MGGIMYRTENLNKSYADGDGVCYALRDVNLDISKGQMVAIVGESGSGKSTLLNILGAIRQRNRRKGHSERKKYSRSVGRTA